MEAKAWFALILYAVILVSMVYAIIDATLTGHPWIGAAGF